MGLENPLHIAVLLLVVLLVFGARRLPEMGHSLGSGLRGFREALSGGGSQPALSAQRQAEPHAQSAPAAPIPGASTQR